MTYAKASNVEDRSSAIIVSFDSRWHDAIKNGRISSIIRKRIPKDTYEWLYIHINSPIGAIYARTKIKCILNITLDEAIKLSDEIGLSEEDISAYAGNANSIGCYKIGLFEFAINIQKTEAIKRVMNYNPPQSFLILSRAAKRIIDEMSEFRVIAADGAVS